MRANETRAGMLYSMGDKEGCLKDRKLFVENLGDLLSQTNMQVISAELDDNEIVTVHLDGGDIKANVNMDSYMSIIIDVVRAIFAYA